jgi:hypothetical protein
VVEVVTARLDSDVVGQQLDVGVGAAVVLLDVWLEVVGVGDLSETWCNHGEGSDRHVVAIFADLSRDVVLGCSHNLGSGQTVWVRDWTLRMVVVYHVLGTPPILDVVVIAFFALHDPMDGARGGVLAIVVEVTSKFSLFTLTVALVDLAAGVATAPVLVEVGA